jgi:hypothetical protein
MKGEMSDKVERMTPALFRVPIMNSIVPLVTVTPKELCKAAQKVLFLDADMCVDSSSYKIQDMLMKCRIEFRMCALMDHFSRSEVKELQPPDERQMSVLRQFLQESKHKHACDCCRGEHSVKGICRIENNVHKMKKTLRLVQHAEMLLQLSKDVEASKRIAIACGSVHDAEALQAFVQHYAIGKVGLYTGKTDNSGDFLDLTKHWDPLQVIRVRAHDNCLRCARSFVWFWLDLWPVLAR